MSESDSPARSFRRSVTLELGEEFLAGVHFEAADPGPQVSYRLAPRIQSR